MLDPGTAFAPSALCWIPATYRQRHAGVDINNGTMQMPFCCCSNPTASIFYIETKTHAHTQTGRQVSKVPIRRRVVGFILISKNAHTHHFQSEENGRSKYIHPDDSSKGHQARLLPAPGRRSRREAVLMGNYQAFRQPRSSYRPVLH